jgi:hypothetical protein
VLVGQLHHLAAERQQSPVLGVKLVNQQLDLVELLKWIDCTPRVSSSRSF